MSKRDKTNSDHSVTVSPRADRFRQLAAFVAERFPLAVDRTLETLREALETADRAEPGSRAEAIDSLRRSASVGIARGFLVETRGAEAALEFGEHLFGRDARVG